MKFQASFIECEYTDSPAQHPDVIDINPFAERGKKDKRVLISQNGAPILILQLFIRTDADGFCISSAFSGFLCNDHAIAVICGDCFHVIALPSGSYTCFPLNDNVGRLYPLPDIYSDWLSQRVLIATYNFVYLVDISRGILWQSEQCAIDGVVIFSVEGDVISGDAEWDPPGGWEPFRMSLSSGKLLSLGDQVYG